MKRFLPILLFTVLTAFHSQAQNKTSVNENPATQGSVLKYYPNPATTVINFELPKNFERGYSLQIYNFLGRKMLEQNNLPTQTSFNLTEFTRGVYVYQLRDKTGKLVESGKFQVSK